ICGMFGSAHMGERAAAAQMADRLIKERGLSSFDVISTRSTTSSGTVDAEMHGVEGLLAEALEHIEHASLWEEAFLFGVSRQRNPLSASQKRKLGEIVQQLRQRTAAT